MKPIRLHHPYSSLLVLLPLLTACQTPVTGLPGPVTYERSPAVQDKVLMNGPQGPTQTQISRIPETPQRQAGTPKSPSAAAVASAPVSTEPISIAIDQTPLPTFIQIMYGSVLKLPYTLDPAVMTRTEPVTFKTSQPLPWDRVKQLAETLLQSYNLVVTDFDGLVRIAPAGSQQVTSAIPVLRSAETSSLPDERRPVFHYIELQVVRTADMAQWLRLMLGARVNLQEDANRNAFMLSGSASDVRSALDLIQAMDQPRLRGRAARRFAPANIGAVELANRLTDVLSAQGYSVASTATGAAAVLVLPVPSISSVIVFAHNEDVMGQVQRWVLELDRPGQNSASSSPLFTYAVRYADAQELARTLNELLGGTVAPAAAPAAGGTTAATPRITGGRVVVNNATNTLIIRGTGQDEQQQIRQLLRELDRPTKSAMIEVVVAELSAGALESLGVDWSYLDPMTSSSSRSVKIGSSGLSISYANSAKQVIAAISALTNDNKGRVLSNPKVMARNGETATIAVGREVPVLTGQQTTLSGSSPIGGGTGVLQTIQYRNTGVNLRVRPVINSGNRLDLEVSQEVSSVAQGETGVGSNPIISNRKIETKLSLRDGSSVLLGGLISRDSSTTDGGVPLLKDIPIIGSAFRKRTDSTAQTELLVMITPYVINDDFEAEEITAALQKTFGDWASDIKTSRVVPMPPKPSDEVSSVGTSSTSPLAPAPQLPTAQAPASAAPVDTSSTLPGTPANTQAARPADAPPPRPEDLGVQLSAPPARSAPATQPAPVPDPPTSPQPRPSSTPDKPASAASEPGKGMISTPVGPGRPVTNPKEREELLKAIRRGQ